MLLRIGHRSDVGRTRTENQDSLLLDVPLFLVADGMGGMRGGGTASALAVEVMQSHVGDLRSSSDPASVLSGAVEEAHRRILQEGVAHPDLSGMGTTLTGAVALEGGGLLLVHVGDSRCYRMRGGALETMTEDDSYVSELVRQGEITPEEAKVHPQRSLITKALGAGLPEGVDPSIVVTDVKAGDRFLLCSDGLHTMLDDSEIEEVLRTYAAPQEAADELVNVANDRNSLDNVTVVVLDVHDIDAGPVQVETAADSSADSAADSKAELQPPLKAEQPAPVEKRGAPATAVGRRNGVLRALLWTGVIVVVVAALAVGGRWYILRNWYVACSGDQLALYRGMPQKVAGVSISRFESVPAPAVMCSQLPRETRDRIGSGVAVHDRSDGTSLIDNYRCQTPGRFCPPRPSG
jgi:PPM family protein phosphatase